MTQDAIPSILQKIIVTKQSEVATARYAKSFAAIKQDATALAFAQKSPRRGFAAALRRQQDDHKVAVIAEIKKASPSKGVICHDFDAGTIAAQYSRAGAACLSVLTDKVYFQGSSQYLQAARDACELPILRKDFMIDSYQIYESYLMGADCILLIVACLDDDTLHDLHALACQLGMDVLIEVHTQSELERALLLPNLSKAINRTEHHATQHTKQQGGQNIYGINNRDLHTFATDLQTSLRLKSLFMPLSNLSSETHLYSETQAAPIQPSPLIVTESGIHSANDMQRLLDHDIYCFLIGEQFMKTPNPGQTLQALLDAV